MYNPLKGAHRHSAPSIARSFDFALSRDSGSNPVRGARVGNLGSKAAVDNGDTSGADDDGFLDHGPYVSYRLRIERPEYTIDGTVVEYLPASQNDGVDLWKVRHDDGDLEDLERHELLQWIRKRPRGRPPAGMRWEGGVWWRVLYENFIAYTLYMPHAPSPLLVYIYICDYQR